MTDLDARVTEFLSGTVPRWLDAAWDREHGGLFDRLGSDGRPVGGDSKTTLVQARGLFTLALLVYAGHASDLLRAAARSIQEFLAGPLAHPEGGWRKAVSRTGEPLDDLRDCYDHAFIVLAFATWLRVEPGAADPEAAWAAVERLFADPTTGGLLEDDATLPKLPRRQNPHMHMFEACLFAWEVTGKEAWRHRLDGLLDPFDRYFLDRDTGTLREFLGGDLEVLAGPRGAIREPGHHYEWVWLLNRYRSLGGRREVGDARDALLAFATAYGRARSGPMAGAVFDEVSPHGRVLSGTHLLWPQTEAIKAHLSEFERTDDRVHREVAREVAELVFDRYVGAETPFWLNQRDGNNAVIWDESLSRLIYHLAVAFTEGVRLDAWGPR